MAKLTYTAIASLDGYIADEQGDFSWSMPDAEVHAFVNDLERPVGTHLYGRRLYEVMKVWEGDDALNGPGTDLPVLRDYAEIWRASEKIVYSRTLDSVETARTRLARAQLRPRLGPSVEGNRRERNQHRRSRPSGPGDRSRSGRRDPPASSASRSRRRQARASDP